MKYLKKFFQNTDYERYIGKKDKILPNVSYIKENKGIYYNPLKPNYFTGVLSATSTSSSYSLFSGRTVDMNNIKLMKVDNVEITPVSAITFNTTGEHTYYVEVNEPLTNMNNMFRQCNSLTSLDLSKWDVSKVTNMYQMFSSCYSLTTVGDLSKWDTSNVTNMQSMFYRCTELTSLDLSKWDTSKVTNMYQMFLFCTSLTTVGDLSNWDVSNVTNMDSMFYNCYKLTSLDLSNWDTSNVTSMGSMFQACQSLTTLDLSKWDVSKVTNMEEMFSGCTSLITVGDLSNWDISNVTYMGGMFSRCTSLTEVRMGGNPSKVTNVGDMFVGIYTTGKFYYNSAYDYSLILTQLPSTWTAVPCTLVNGELIPN